MVYKSSKPGEYDTITQLLLQKPERGASVLARPDLGGSLAPDRAMIPGLPCHGGCRGLGGRIGPGPGEVTWGDLARPLGGQHCTESTEGPAMYRIPLGHLPPGMDRCFIWYLEGGRGCIDSPSSHTSSL